MSSPSSAAVRQRNDRARQRAPQRRVVHVEVAWLPVVECLVKSGCTASGRPISSSWAAIQASSAARSCGGSLTLISGPPCPHLPGRARGDHQALRVSGSRADSRPNSTTRAGGIERTRHPSTFPSSCRMVNNWSPCAMQSSTVSAMTRRASDPPHLSISSHCRPRRKCDRARPGPTDRTILECPPKQSSSRWGRNCPYNRTPRVL
jgi:hypothetical protein